MWIADTAGHPAPCPAGPDWVSLLPCCPRLQTTFRGGHRTTPETDSAARCRRQGLFPIGNGQAPGIAIGRGATGAGPDIAWDAGFTAAARFLAAGFFLTAFFLAGFRAGFFLPAFRLALFLPALFRTGFFTTFFFLTAFLAAFLTAFFLVAFFFAFAMRASFTIDPSRASPGGMRNMRTCQPVRAFPYVAPFLD